MKFLFDNDVPDDLSYVLRELGHSVTLLRDAMPVTSSDEEVLGYASANGFVLVTCNRDDFVALAASQSHPGIIVVFRRKSRMAERNALVRLLGSAGEQGIAGNATFA